MRSAILMEYKIRYVAAKHPRKVPIPYLSSNDEAGGSPAILPPFGKHLPLGNAPTNSNLGYSDDDYYYGL